MAVECDCEKLRQLRHTNEIVCNFQNVGNEFKTVFTVKVFLQQKPSILKIGQARIDLV